jgi:UDP-galactopyranose mutase
MRDDELIERGKRELEQIGLVKASVVETGYVVRTPKAYPMYDATYKQNVAELAAWLDEHTPNVFPVGRNGMHRYNNQDHSMLTAKAAVDCIGSGRTEKDAIWSVNVDDEYHESK